MDLKLDDALKLAKKTLKEGSAEEAKRIYQDILRRFPANKKAKIGLKALSGSPVGKGQKVLDPPQDQQQLLINLYSQGQLQQALDQVKILLEQFPHSPVLFNIQGAVLKGLGQLELSIEAYSKALAIKPKNADAYINMGNTLKDQGKLEKAIEAYNKALTIKPNNADAYINMGITLKDQGELEEAIEAYNKALAIKPDYAEAHYNMGNALKDQGKLEEAIEAYNKALAIKPDYAEARYNMGNALKDQGKLEEAIEAYNKALAIKPNNADALNNMGNALKDQGKLEEAIEAYNKALAIKPKNADAYINMGNALKDQGELEKAIEAYNKALAIKPNNADAHNNMGNALKDQGKLEKAIEAYNKALAIKPDYSEAQHMVSSLTGKTTASAPRQYIENLFDGYAKKFEQSLVKNLEYTIPKMLTDIILKEHNGGSILKEHGGGSLGLVLDLGCGTGLTGLEIKDFCSSLKGIDLSKKMLELANAKNVYDQLSHSDIIEYLSNEELNFDYFISTDVFIYVGDLSDVFWLIKSKNKRSGKLVFSTEHTELDGFQLEKTGRYSHSKTYIEELCARFKYTISHFSMVNLRKEKGQFLTGGLYILDF